LMNGRYLARVSLVIVPLLSIPACEGTSHEAILSLEEEYAIYSTVLRKIAGYPRVDPTTGEYPLPGLVVLIDRTGLGHYKNAESGTLSRHLSAGLSLDVGPLVDDLLDNNRSPLVLENKFNLDYVPGVVETR